VFLTVPVVFHVGVAEMGELSRASTVRQLWACCPDSLGDMMLDCPHKIGIMTVSSVGIACMQCQHRPVEVC